MRAFHRLSACAALFVFVAGAHCAIADEDLHCPAATSSNSSRFYSKDADSSADRRRVADLAKGIIKEGKMVCLLALMDPTGASYSKKLALNRVNWMRGSLIKEGVPLSAIGYELRPAETATDPDMSSVLIIVGR